MALTPMLDRLNSPDRAQHFAHPDVAKQMIINSASSMLLQKAYTQTTDT